MENVWPTILINGAVLLALGSALWRANNHRIELARKGLDRKVDRDYCGLQHKGIHDDIREIKAGQQRMALTLEEIRIRLARENGKRSAEKEGK